MDVTIAIKVTADEIGWAHVYGDEWAATPENVRQAAEDGLYAGETPFYFVSVEAERVVVSVAPGGWAVVMPDTELTEEAVIEFVRSALEADGTMNLIG